MNDDLITWFGTGNFGTISYTSTDSSYYLGAGGVACPVGYSALFNTICNDYSTKERPLLEAFGDNTLQVNYITFNTIIKRDWDGLNLAGKTVKECLDIYGKDFIQSLAIKSFQFFNNNKMNNALEKCLLKTLNSIQYNPFVRKKHNLSIF